MALADPDIRQTFGITARANQLRRRHQNEIGRPAMAWPVDKDVNKPVCQQRPQHH